MLRMCCRSSKGLVFSSPHLLSLKTTQPSVRYLSSGGGGAAKILGTTLAITTGAIGGVVVYSNVDPDFRKIVEENIPGSTSLVGLLLGDQNASVHVEHNAPDTSVSCLPLELEKEETLGIAPEKYEETAIFVEEATTAETVNIPIEEANATEVAIYAEAAKTVAEEALAAEAAIIVAEEAAEARRTAADEAAAVESKIIAEEKSIAAQEAAAAEEASKAAEEAKIIAADEVAAAEAERIAKEEAVAAASEEAGKAARIAEKEASEAERIAVDEAAAAELTRIAEVEALAAEADKVAAVEAAVAEKAMIAEGEAAEAAKISAQETAAAEEVRISVETARIAEEETAEALKIAADEAAAAELSRLEEEEIVALEAATFAAAAAAEKAIMTAEEVRITEEEAAEASRLAENDAAAAEATRVAEEAAAEALKVEAQASSAAKEAIIAAEEVRLVSDAPAAAETEKCTIEEADTSITSAEEEVAEAASIAAEESSTPEAVRLTEDEASKTTENVKLDLVETKDTSGSEAEGSLADEVAAENITESAETVSVIDSAKESNETEEAATEVEAVDKATVRLETTESIPEEEAETSETEILNVTKDFVLVDLCNYIEEIAAGVVSDYEASSYAVMAHTNLLQNMLDSDQTPSDDTVWDEIFIAARAKTEAAKTSETREQEALEAITKAVDLIAAERKDETETSNSELMIAEETANRAIFIMEQAKAKNAAIQSEATVMEECGELLKVGREQFHKEMSSIMPDIKLGEKNGTLTEFELNMFITHAYKKVLYLQQEVAKQQTFEQERFTKALEKQKLEIENLALEEMDEELYRQGKELRSEHEMLMAAIREKAEGELRDHLRRQAGAHTDHVTDVLTTQAAELARHHKHEMDEYLDTLTSKHVNSIASLSGTVSGLTEALDCRAASDSASLSAQKLWVACTALNSAVNMGRMDATTWEEKLQPLHKKVEQVKMAAGEEDKFVEIVLASISPVALERGVYTEDILKERFNLVEKMARRVAGIGEDGGSLLAFGLSFLASLLVIDLTNRTQIENLKVDDFGAVSEIVRLAKYSLDEGNIARAVQMLVQLKGESGRVVKDWVAEATLTLETRQAVQAILVHSQASSCKNMPDV